jgi:hypothetical protein
MTSPFNSVVGLHYLSIDTSNDTGDVGFWTTGGEFVVVLSPDETVDGEIVVSVIGSFSIERAGVSLAMLKNASYGLVTLESIVSSNETDLTTLLARVVGTILAGNHTAQSGDSFARIGVDGASLTGVGLSAAAVDAILDDPIEGAVTLRQVMRVLLAYLAGRATGGGTAAPKFRDQANTKDRISMTVDGVGNRSAVTLDLT